MEFKDYKYGSMVEKLKQEDDCPKMLLTICNFTFTNMIQNFASFLGFN